MKLFIALLPMYVSGNTVRTYSVRKERNMIQTPYPTPKPRNSYEIVGRRLQGLIASPRVQRIQLVEVTRRDDESPEAWRQVIQDIGDTAGIRIEHLEDGAVRIGWREYCDT
jgi:predicted subunit of tRNA(5-methylaminomethyl-2-thiouridylate) methyltransferase